MDELRKLADAVYFGNELRNWLGATTRLFLITVAAWLSMQWLTIPIKLDRGVEIALWGMTLVRNLIHTRQRATSAAEEAASVNILRFIGIAAVWAVALLMLLANLGVAIMPLVAGLGIGGLAIALAVQGRRFPGNRGGAGHSRADRDVERRPVEKPAAELRPVAGTARGVPDPHYL